MEKRVGPPTIAIFPASRYQVPLIQAALDRGFSVVTMDPVPGNPGHKSATHSHLIDVLDTQSVLDGLQSYEIVAAASPCSDISLKTLSTICEVRKLRGPSRQAVAAMTLKSSFRRLQHTIGLNAPAFVAVDSSNLDLPQIKAKFEGQHSLLVKPDFSSGSKGISVVERSQLSISHLEFAIAHSSNNKAVVESYVSGSHGTLEGFVKSGRLGLHITTLRMRNVDGVGTVGHVLPGDYSETEISLLHGEIEKLLDAVGYLSGPLDVDFIFNEGLPTIIEATPRLGGNSLSSLFFQATGVRQEDVYIDWLLGGESCPESRSIGDGFATLILHTAFSGRLTYDYDALACIDFDWLVQSSLDYPSGEFVREFSDGRDRFGEILIKCSSEQDAVMKRSQFSKAIKLVVERID